MHSVEQHFDESQSVSWGKLTDVKIHPALAPAKVAAVAADTPNRWLTLTVDNLLSDARSHHENAVLFPLAAGVRVGMRVARLR
jgi:hypothetical protein